MGRGRGERERDGGLYTYSVHVHVILCIIIIIYAPYLPPAIHGLADNFDSVPSLQTDFVIVLWQVGLHGLIV